MRKLISLLLLPLLCASLTGCRQSSFLENQAYAVIMGVDLTEDDNVELTFQTPKLASGSDGKATDEYVTLSATGGTFGDAIEALRVDVGRELNMTELILIVFSEEIAKSDRSFELMTDIYQSYEHYNAAYFAVSEGKAKDFVKAQKVSIGTRLSIGFMSRIEDGFASGNIPYAKFADMYYLIISDYSDTLAIRCALQEKPTETSEPMSAAPEDIPVESENKNIYLGSYIMRKDRAIATLSGEETLFAGLVTGSVTNFRYGSTSFVPSRKPRIRIKTDSDQVSIDISIKLLAMGTFNQTVTDSIIEGVDGVIKKCQNLTTEPLGFADIAAKNFLTMENWQRYNWREKFANAKVTVNIFISEMNS